MAEVDQWRESVLTLLSSYTEPVSVLLVVLAFSLGMLSIRALG
jgi:hypothetical protein